MEINRFKKINEDIHINPRYVIRDVQDNGGWYTVPTIEDDGNGEFNYDEYDIKSVVGYLVECSDNHNGKLEFYKITEEFITDTIIDKIKEEIKLDKDTKKYNL